MISRGAQSEESPMSYPACSSERAPKEFIAVSLNMLACLNQPSRKTFWGVLTKAPVGKHDPHKYAGTRLSHANTVRTLRNVVGRWVQSVGVTLMSVKRL